MNIHKLNPFHTCTSFIATEGKVEFRCSKCNSKFKYLGWYTIHYKVRVYWSEDEHIVHNEANNTVKLIN